MTTGDWGIATRDWEEIPYLMPNPQSKVIGVSLLVRVGQKSKVRNKESASQERPITHYCALSRPATLTLLITHYCALSRPATLTLLITHYSLLITHYSLLITHYSLLITYYSIPNSQSPIPYQWSQNYESTEF